VTLGRARLATYHMAVVLGASVIRSKNQRKHESSPVPRDQARVPLVNIGTLHRARYKLLTG